MALFNSILMHRFGLKGSFLLIAAIHKGDGLATTGSILIETA